MRLLGIVLLGSIGLALPSDAQERLAITSITVIDGRTGQAKSGHTIVVEGQRIVAVGPHDSVSVPPGTRIIDGRGKWVTPGFVDVHAHSTPPAVLRRALALGVTTIHMMPSVPAPPDTFHSLEVSSNAPTSRTPRVVITSPLFTGRFPGNVLPRAVNFATPKDVAEVQEKLSELNRTGFKSIKVIQDDGRLWTSPEAIVPRLPDDVFRELVGGAHRLGMRVYGHVTQLTDTRQAIAAGVDVFVHGTMDSVLVDSLWTRMRDRRIVWAPAFRIVAAGADASAYARRVLADAVLRESLSATESTAFVADTMGTARPPDMPFPGLRPNGRDYIRVIRENTRRARTHGLTIAVGSDAGISGNGPGIGTHLEMELLQEAGLTPAQVVVAATFGGAVAIGVQDGIGTIERGKLADMVILSRNPLLDIRNARAIEWVVKGGTPIRRDELVSGGRN